MGQAVAMSANVTCSFGAAPSTLVVLPDKRVLVEGKPIANVMDSKPLVNILPFGMCNTPTNPVVAAATAAALGVLTPMPCVPAVSAPWIVGSPNVMVGNMPVANNSCRTVCNWGGQITITMPGTTTVQVP